MPNVLQIGASVNVAELKAGMEEAAGNVRSSTAQMSAQFKTLAVEASQSVQEISGNWVKAAEASLVLRSAQSEVRAATKAAKDAEDDDTAALARLAIAKRSVAAASEAQALAIKAATVGEVEEEGSLTILSEKLIESAEAAQIAGAGMAGFAGVAGLLGGGVLVGFLAHLEDEVAQSVIELDHLSAKTGIAITSLAGLQQVTRSLGVEFEPVSIGLIRMARAQQEAVEGNKAAVTAFGRLGITVEQLKSLSPEQLFYRVATAIKETGSSAAVADSSIAIFGRGGAALIPIFKDAGTNLAAMVRQAGEASGVTEQAAASAREWRADVAELSQMLRSLATQALTPLLVIIKALKLGFEVLGAAAATVVRSIVSGFIAAGKGAVDFGRILYDASHGNIVLLMADAAALKADFTQTLKSGADDIDAYWRKVAADRDKLFATPPALAEGGENLPAPAQGKPGKDSHLQDIQIKAAEAHALALVEIERKQYEDDQKLQEEAARQNGTLTASFYQAQEQQQLAFVNRELAIKQDAIVKLQALDKQKKPEERDASLAGQAQAAEDAAAKQRVDINARSQEQIVKVHQDGEKEIERILTQLTEAERKQTAADSEEAKKQLEQREQLMRERLSIAQRLANEELEATLRSDDRALEHGRMSAKQWADAEIEAVNEWAARKRQILEQSLQQERQIHGSETVEYMRLKDQEVQLEQQAADKRRQIEEKLDQETKQLFEQTMRSEVQDLFNGLNQMLQGHKTFAQAMAQTWNSMVMTLIRGIEQWAMKWLQENVIMRAANLLFGTQQKTQATTTETARVTAHQTANTSILTSDTALAAAQTAAQTTAAVTQAAQSAAKIAENNATNEAIVVSDAGVAAAAGFASVMAALPFPANVATAPEVAAAALAQVLGFGAAAAFETGGIMPRTGLVLAHEKEGILPRNLTEMLISAANGGGTQKGARGGNSFHIPITYAPVINHPMSDADVEAHLDVITAGVRSRMNGLGF
ncbi:MAG TPA: hypothetical protein VMR62_18625 [Bryobacteraceae bacterium]|jgi:hypothetical protein|nr:hypothetical protein [Bryobacteraceae bacterium]